MRTMVSAAVAVLVIAAAGLAAWRIAGPRPVAPTSAGPDVAVGSAADDGLLEQLADLRQRLEDERDARLQLAARVEQLDETLASRDAAAAEAAARAGGAELTIVGESQAGTPAEDRAGPGVFDAEKLIAVGLTASEAAWLHEKWEQRQLAELYLADQAARQRWGFRKLRKEREAARSEFQAEIGLDMYDSMLYAAGDYNRVVVRDVYAGSAAESAGLRVGDHVVRYADSPVFRVEDLRRLTRQGETGELVSIRVERGGGIDRLQVERGPLGVLIGRERVEPGIE